MIDKTGYNRLVYDIALKRVGYIQTHSNKETKIFWFKPEMKIEIINDFVNLVKTFKQTCSKYKNYCYYDLCHDIEYRDHAERRLATENEGPTKEVIISRDNLNERMYYYKERIITVSKIGNYNKVLKNIGFKNVNNFTAFAEEVAQYCTENKLSYAKYINSDYVKQHLALRRNFVREGEQMKADVLAVSFCRRGGATIVYYDNKKTTLLTIEKYKDNFFEKSFIPVKLEEDFQTVEEFQQWIENDVKLKHIIDYSSEESYKKCMQRIWDLGEYIYNNYEEFVDESNREYDGRHKMNYLSKNLIK